MNNTEIMQLLALIASVVASQGFWNYLNFKLNKTTKIERLLKALVHDKISYLTQRALSTGSVSAEQYRLMSELYVAYREIGGNGTVTKLMAMVDELPITPKDPD